MRVHLVVFSPKIEVNTGSQQSIDSNQREEVRNVLPSPD
jgi:hypothetical protein